MPTLLVSPLTAGREGIGGFGDGSY